MINLICYYIIKYLTIPQNMGIVILKYDKYELYAYFFGKLGICKFPMNY